MSVAASDWLGKTSMDRRTRFEALLEEATASRLVQVCQEAATLQDAWREICPRWQEADPQFVEALFRASDEADRAGNLEQALRLLRLAWLIAKRKGHADWQARSLFNAALVFHDREPRKATDLYQQALVLWRQQETASGQRRTADCHHQLGNLYLLCHNDLDAAERAYREALAIYEAQGHTQDIADTLNGLGNVLRLRGKLTEALDCLQRAVHLARETEQPRRLASKLNSLGLALQMAGDVAGAVQAYREALEFLPADQEPATHCVLLGNLGGSLMAIGQPTEALTILSKGLAIACQHSLSRDEAHLLSLTGAAQVYTGAVDEAETTLCDAVAAFDALEDSVGAAACLTNLGLCAQSQLRLQEAIRYHSQALVRYRQAGERQSQAQVLINLGAVYQMVGDLEGAEECFAEAAAICREIGYRQGEGSALGGLGLIYLERGDLDAAKEAYQQVLVIDETIGYRRGTAMNLANLGLIAFEHGDLPAAADYYRRSVAEAEAINDADGQAASWQMLGRIARLTGDDEAAESFLGEAELLAQHHNLSEVLRNVHRDQAHLAWSRGDMPVAYGLFREAIAAQEKARGGLWRERHRLSYQGQRAQSYAETILLCLEMDAASLTCEGQAARRVALELGEAARSRTLVEALAQTWLAMPANVPETLRASEVSLLARRQVALARLEEAIVEEAGDILGELDEIRVELDRTREEMAFSTPEYVDLRRGGPISYKELQVCLRRVGDERVTQQDCS
jgi:tetratricopeptide (TPR) repeat protein